MPKYFDTMRRFVPYEFVVDAAIFTGVGQSVEIAPDPAFRVGQIITDVTIYKEVAFDASAGIQLGSGAVAAVRETLATETEVAAGTVGVSKPVAWLPTLGFGGRLITGDMRLFARVTTGVPTVGRLRIIFSVLERQGRGVL